MASSPDQIPNIPIAGQGTPGSASGETDSLRQQLAVLQSGGRNPGFGDYQFTGAQGVPLGPAPSGWGGGSGTPAAVPAAAVAAVPAVGGSGRNPGFGDYQFTGAYGVPLGPRPPGV